MSDTTASSRSDGSVTFRTPGEVVEGLAYLESNLDTILRTLRLASAPPDGLLRHIDPIKVAEVATRLGVSPAWINQNQGRLKTPVKSGRNSSFRVYYPENIYELRKLLDIGLKTPPKKAVQSIAVVNQKGGVGKTTTCVTLASEAAFLGLRVLLIDMDPQASTTASFLIRGDDGQLHDPTISPFELDATIKPVLMGALHDIRPLIRKTQWETIDLIPASPDLIQGEFELIKQLMVSYAKDGPSMTQGRRVWDSLQRALRSLTTDEYDLVILDTAPSMTITSVIVGLASHGLLFPSPARNLDIESLRAYVKTLHEWMDDLQHKYQIDIRWIRFLTTMKRNDSAIEVRNERAMRRRLSEFFIADPVPRTEALLRSTAGAPSVYEVQPERPASAARTAKEARQILSRVYSDLFSLVERTYKEM